MTKDEVRRTKAKDKGQRTKGKPQKARNPNRKEREIPRSKDKGLIRNQQSTISNFQPPATNYQQPSTSPHPHYIISPVNQVWILHNSLAGNPGNTVKVERAAEALARRGLAVRLERSPTIEGLRRAAREAVAARADAVLVASGDGSLGTIAAELAGSPVALGFLPAGTANVWARELNLPTLSWLRPQALEQAALSLVEGRVRQVDMGRCNGRLFLLWAGMGLDAFVMQHLESRRQLLSRRIGLLYNVTAAFFHSRAWQGAQMRVVVGEREVSGHYLMAVIANVSWYGGLF